MKIKTKLVIYYKKIKKEKNKKFLIRKMKIMGKN